MLKCAFAICAKDLRLTLLHGAGLIQALLLGLLLVFLFSLSLDIGDRLSPQAAAAMFWLASAFCQVLLFNMLYAVEERGQARLGLLLLPAPVQSIWLGKALAGVLLLFAAQCVFVPAVFVFLGQNLGAGWDMALLGIALGDVGMAASGSLLGALSVGQSGRESLLSLVLFPLLVPMLLAGVRLVSFGLSPDAISGEAFRWLGLAAAFDALFLAAGLVLFPFVYSGED
ncbi:heme exporter protein CcmB [uncultured Mailhella sp.]|uniref:heme exporter protein CcmB n=1 Tax=uncultured Mailhella sp. TaxID=1981031 RepID=UPI00262CAD2C|nr:heme exporter protein CcmB [uncultured Mailhella sp.]